MARQVDLTLDAQSRQTCYAENITDTYYSVTSIDQFLKPATN